MQFMAVDAFAMIDRNPVAAPKQSFAGTASALFANVLHNLFPLVMNSGAIAELSSNCAVYSHSLPEMPGRLDQNSRP